MFQTLTLNIKATFFTNKGSSFIPGHYNFLDATDHKLENTIKLPLIYHLKVVKFETMHADSSFVDFGVRCVAQREREREKTIDREKLGCSKRKERTKKD